MDIFNILLGYNHGSVKFYHRDRLFIFPFPIFRRYIHEVLIAIIRKLKIFYVLLKPS